MYRNILFAITLLSVFITASVSTTLLTHAQQWSYIGIARTDHGNSFYLFLNYSSNIYQSGKRDFTEKHSFIRSQNLPTGQQYKSVEISRIMDCENRKVADIKALFKNKAGIIVEEYSSSSNEKYSTIVAGNNVNYEVFRILCNK